MKLRWALPGLLLALAALYAATPLLAGFLLPAVLARSGVDASHFSFEYPGLGGVDVNDFWLRIGGARIDGESMHISYRFAQLLRGRVDSVALARLTVRLGGETQPDDADAGPFEVPRFWELVPAERVNIDQLFVASDAPAAEARGALRFDPEVLQAHLDVVSPLLAMPLKISATTYPDGRLAVTVMERDVATPLLALTAATDSGKGLLGFDGRLALAGTPLELVAAYTPMKLASGSVHVQFKGNTPWPLAADDQDGWRRFIGTGSYSVELSGQMPDVQLVRAQLDGDFSVRDGGIAGKLNPGSKLSVDLAEAEASGSSTAPRVVLTADEPVSIDYADNKVRVGDGLILTSTIARSSVGVRARGAWDAAGPFELAITALDGAPVVLATGAITDAQLVVHGQLALAGKMLGLVAAPLGATKTTGHLVGDFDGSMPWPATNSIELQNISGKGRIAIALTGHMGPARSFDTTIDGEYALRGGLLDVTLAPGAHVLFAADGVEVTTIDATVVGADLRQARVAVEPMDFKLALPELALGKRKVVLDNAWVTLEHVTRNGDAITAGLILRTHAGRGALPVQVTLDHDLAARAGRFVVAADWPAKKPLLAAQLPGFNAPYDLDEGSLRIAMKGAWDLNRASLEASGHVHLDGRRAHYDDYLVSGIVADLPVTLDGATYKVADAPVSIDSIDVGFPLTGIKLYLAVADQIAEVRDLGGSVLGGRFVSDAFGYVLPTDQATMQMRIEGIELAQVLALEGGDVQGSGRLDGVLPIVLDGEDISVDAGRVTARAPGGTLMYKSGATASVAQTGMAFVFQALEDFRYELLDAKVVLSPAGDLALAIQLRGHNPAVENGRAIQFNLNVNESLPALFQSLRAAEGITNRIEDTLAR